MSPQVPQDFLEDAFAVWERLRRWTDMNSYLSTLRSSPFSQYPHSEKDPYSLRLARRVTKVIESLESRVEVTVDGDITPRGALLALANDVRFSLSIFPVLPFCEWVNSNLSAYPASLNGATATDSKAASFCTATTGLKIISNNNHSAITNDDWGTAIRQRSVSGVVIMEGVHVLTCPGVQLRIGMTVERLREKMRQELVGGADSEAFTHTPKELQALRATTMLLDDFETIYSRLIATFSCLRTMCSSHIPVALLPIVYEQYYQMGEWVLETEFTAKAKPGAYVQSFDPKTMRAMVRRAEDGSPWGLRFSNGGKLIGVSAIVRSASTAGQKLHQFIESTKGGLSILTYNMKDVNFDTFTAEQVVEKLTKMSRKQKRMYLKLHMGSDAKPSVEQLAFYTVQSDQQQSQEQQKEIVKNKEGQDEMEFPRATLVLSRDSCGVSWDMAITRDLIVMSVPVGILSPEAVAFFSSHPNQVRIKGINGVEVTSAFQLEALSSTVNTIVLDLCIIQPPSVPKCDIKAENKNIEDKIKYEHSTFDDKSYNTSGKNPLAELKKTTLTSTDTRHLINLEEKKKRGSNFGDCAVDDKKIENNFAYGVKTKPPNVTLPSNKRNSALEKESFLSGREENKIERLKNNVNHKETTIYELSDADIIALKEEPLVSVTSRYNKTGFPPLGSQTLHDRGNKMSLETLRERNNVENKVNFAQVNNSMSLKKLTSFLDDEGTNLSARIAEVDGVAPLSPALPEKSPQVRHCEGESQKKEEREEKPLFDAAIEPGPLKFPNNVTLNLLTPDEMIISRQSADKKWGLSMETVGQDTNRTIRVTGLPLLIDQSWRKHKFYDLFNSHKGNWRILSVNGTPATKLPEVMDVMKHALRMQIKFHKRW